MPVVDVFDRSRLFKLSILEAGGQGAIFPPEPWSIDQHSEPFLATERGDLGLLHLLLASLNHAVQLQAG
jgi:hypothetical protein